MSRDREIYYIHATRVNSTHIYLDLITQAGTFVFHFLAVYDGRYVKEFVHGDFERTKPNLSMFLKSEGVCDLVLLDGVLVIERADSVVVRVDFPWPPKTSEGVLEFTVPEMMEEAEMGIVSCDLFLG
jgi:hypothetical protein